ncbi:hypothetical protein [Actinoplanes siamensis]|uniref:DUF3800 domain-containing protein n=1 Tax=Actinoplanes siamensis TaxID=1223317 RepID=A0A919N286_9ACTN|nr:hypothetical protein [Actinoplanes siamensis]GIF03431.1 hypothetical protein Asi03nite_09690 [Actinoplanes siamensis]
MGGVRTPLQGGLPPSGAVAGAVVEIACDESGFSGTNLLRSGAPVITHASVDLTGDEARELITGLSSSRHEVKAGQLLRGPGAAIDWFLAALAGRAHVCLIDKELFLITSIAGLLLGDAQRAAGLARHPAGPERDAFLAAFIDLVRSKRRRPLPPRVERFFRARDALRPGTPADELDPVHVRAVVTRLDQEDRSIPPPLEPLLPALASTVLHWSGPRRRRVLVTHDEQSALTADRLTRLQLALAGPDGVSPLAGLVMADSRDDPRVQVADLLAGVARRSAPGALEAAGLVTSRSVPGVPVTRG